MQTAYSSQSILQGSIKFQHFFCVCQPGSFSEAVYKVSCGRASVTLHSDSVVLWTMTKQVHTWTPVFNSNYLVLLRCNNVILCYELNILMFVLL